MKITATHDTLVFRTDQRTYTEWYIIPSVRLRKRSSFDIDLFFLCFKLGLSIQTKRS